MSDMKPERIREIVDWMEREDRSVEQVIMLAYRERMLDAAKICEELIEDRPFFADRRTGSIMCAAEIRSKVRK